MKMKAMHLTSHGKARLVKVEKPTPGQGEVLVRVKYSALDTHTQAVLQTEFSGTYFHTRTNPLILGWHYVGTVAEVGENVKDLEVNDTVWGFLQYEPSQRQGSFSEFITVPVTDTALKPSSIKDDVVAAAGTETLTGLQAMRDEGGLTNGKSVLVVGASGGVGSVAVGIAKQLGADVTAVYSTKDVDRVKAYGADVIMDRSKVDPFSEGDTKYDLIFDTPCAYSVSKCMNKLNPKGCYVGTLPTVSLFAGKCIALFHGKGATFVVCRSKKEDLELVGKWLVDGKVKVDIDSTYDIKDLGGALERQRSCERIGRIVIRVQDGWLQYTAPQLIT